MNKLRTVFETVLVVLIIGAISLGTLFGYKYFTKEQPLGGMI